MRVWLMRVSRSRFPISSAGPGGGCDHHAQLDQDERRKAQTQDQSPARAARNREMSRSPDRPEKGAWSRFPLPILDKTWGYESPGVFV
jgi:hypothetical protein